MPFARREPRLNRKRKVHAVLKGLEQLLSHRVLSAEVDVDKAPVPVAVVVGAVDERIAAVEVLAGFCST